MFDVCLMKKVIFFFGNLILVDVVCEVLCYLI